MKFTIEFDTSDPAAMATMRMILESVAGKGGQPAAQQQTPAVTMPVQPAAPASPTPASAPVAPAPVMAAAATPTSTASPIVDGAVPAAQLSAAMGAYIQKNGAGNAKKILNEQLGIAKLQDCPPEKSALALQLFSA